VNSLDFEKLVEMATRAIFERLNNGATKVAVFGDVPDGLISGAEIKAAKNCADAGGCDYVLLSAASFEEITGTKISTGQTVTQISREGTVLDFTGKRLLHERDLRDMNAARGDTVKVSSNTIVTALAHDYAKGIGAKIEKS